MGPFVVPIWDQGSPSRSPSLFPFETWVVPSSLLSPFGMRVPHPGPHRCLYHHPHLESKFHHPCPHHCPHWGWGSSIPMSPSLSTSLPPFGIMVPPSLSPLLSLSLSPFGTWVLPSLSLSLSPFGIGFPHPCPLHWGWGSPCLSPQLSPWGGTTAWMGWRGWAAAQQLKAMDMGRGGRKRMGTEPL